MLLLLPLGAFGCGGDTTAKNPDAVSAATTGGSSSTNSAAAVSGGAGGTLGSSSATASTNGSSSTGGSSTTSSSSTNATANATSSEASSNTLSTGATSTSTGLTSTTSASTTGGVLTGTPVERNGPLSVDGTSLVNQAGNPVQLKGPSSMWLHWEDDGYAESLAALTWMRDNWNLSVIRAAMGIEPEGAYLTDPEASRAKVGTIIENAIAAGVYVIVDWHDHNAHDHQSEAQAFFTEIAQTYGNVPNVIYEPYNEPEQVDWASVVKPYHEALVGTIRALDPDNLIILGTPNWSQYVDEAAGNPVAGTNLLYTLHFYSCSHTAWLRDTADAARALGAALFVTEWGATHADGGLDGEVCLEEAALWHDWMNQNQISWTAWKLDNCEDSSCYFEPDGAPLEGNFTDEYLQGHGPFVRDRMRE